MGGYLLDALVGHGPLGEGPLVSPLSSEEVAGLGFERVVGSAPVSIVIVDVSGRVIYSNERARALTAGLGREMPTELDRAIDIFHPDGRRYEHHEWPAIRSITDGEEILDEEFFYPLRDGRRLWIRCSSSPLRDGVGKIVAAVLAQTDVTEQRRQDVRLAYLAGLLDNSEDAIVAFDAEWHVTAWNGGAERMYGWSAEEVIGRVLLSFIRVDLSDEQQADVRQQAAERGRWRGEASVERKDGLIVSVEAITVAIRDGDGEITGYLAIHRDITDRKRSAEAVGAAQRRAETILDSITDEFFALDRDWRYTYVNGRGLAKARGVLGLDLTAADLLGKEIWERFPQLVGTTFDHEAHRAMRGQTAVELETYSPVTGRWLEVRMYPSDVGLSIYLHDISPRKQADEQLRYHASLLENVEDGVIATDAEDFRVTAWNRGAERLYGFSAEEVLGRPAREIASFPGDEARRMLERELLKTGRTRIEFTARRKDGASVEVELIAVAVNAEHEQTGGYLGIHRDISDRKRAERAMREAQRQTETVLQSITDAFVAFDPDWRYRYVNERALRRLRSWRGEELMRDQIVGRSVWELFPDLIGGEVERRLHDVMKAQEPAEFELHFRPTGRWVQVHAYPSPEGLSVYFHDIGHRKQVEEELERSVHEQAAVAELGLRALEDVGLRSLMDEAVTLAGRTLGVEYAKVDELLPGGEGLLVRAGAGWRDGVVGSCVMPMGRGSPAGYALLAGEPVIVEDMTADTPFEVPAVLREHGVMSHITVVIDPGSHPFGTLVAASTERRTFSEDDVSFVQSVANVLAAAIERAKSDERLQRAEEAERSRIGRALHDEVLQGLADALALAIAARRASPESAPSSQLVPVLRRVGQQLRGAIYDLRLESELHSPFPRVLEQLVAVHRALAVDCAIELDMAPGTPTGSLGVTGIEVLRIVGEALTNVRRHADARHARVRVWGVDDKLWAEVSDDGRGFDPTSPQSPGHHGRTGMRERAEQLGGRVEIDSAPGVGTTVRLQAILPNGSSGAS